MTTTATPQGFWKRYRTPVFITVALAWVAGISYLHLTQNRRTTKGATELLQIGALPVT